MEHDGYESDKNRLMALDLASHTVTDLTAQYDNNVDCFTLDADNKTIWFISDEKAKDQIFKLDLPQAYSKQPRVSTTVCCRCRQQMMHRVQMSSQRYLRS